jgi:hypothetical protein
MQKGHKTPLERSRQKCTGIRRRLLYSHDWPRGVTVNSSPLRHHVKTRSLFSAICVFLLFSAHHSQAAFQAWTASDTVRALRDEPAAGTQNATLSAARNEWVSFQILVRGDTPVRGVNVEPGDLTGPDGSLIRAADAVLYREHQLELTLPSCRNNQFKPGWYPDPLIPFRHPLTKQFLPADARIKAVPFELPAGQTHGFWVDLFVPHEAKPGRYTGTYSVSADGQNPVKLAVELMVWNFELPRVPSFQTALGSPAERMRGYYAKRAKAGKEPEPQDWEVVEAQVADELSRHRINATPSSGLLIPKKQADDSFAFSETQVDALRKFVDTYRVNAIQTPHPRSFIDDPDAERAKLHAWLKSFDRLAAELNRPEVTFFTYLKDEPNQEEEYRYIQKWGPAVRSAKSVVKVMVVEQTKTQDPKWGDLYGAVDIWCPLFPLHDEETAAQRRALGETIWTYTALCQRDPTPWWEIDFPLLNYRIPAWIAWRYQMRGLLYWGGMSHWSGVEDPWTDPKTLDRRTEDGKGQLYQGEGTLVYPGRAVGYDGIAPSLRLKALRKGIQDYEYLAILDRAGLGAEARQIVMPLASSWFQWEKDAAAYDRARMKLAALIGKTRKN